MSVQQRPAASPPTFAAASAVQQVSTHTYRATFDASWSVGSVPHGGIVTSVLLRCADLHFGTTLAAQHQPHAITLHAEFLRRTQAGPATLRVRDVKLGRQTSTVHVTLSQPTTATSSSGDSDSSSSSNEREEVVAYITHTNLAAESGPTFETGWQLDPPPPPPPSDFAALIRGSDADAHWAEWTAKPFPEFRKVIQQMRIYLPRGGRHAADSLCDEWIRFADPAQRFTDASLGLVSDLWPQVIESLKTAAAVGQFWYPTLLLNLDIKKALPAEGVEWLFVRVRAKRIRNGRQDLEVVILDQQGEIVALSHHVALVLDAKRNTAKRSRPSSKI
ncbi:hypothetical protein PG997_013284 [Apiospora hydei]|uniref:Thioesterase-like superfamily-domain-containing protein n=1 Tax=Apiospora hydei TaxID=1337664 RepID=A0ABR1V5S4_9PEZI